MKTKIFLLSVVVVLILAMVAGAVWWTRRPQVIAFDDGSKLMLLAVDFGKHHTPPGAKSTSTGARPRRGGAFNTTDNTLVLWVQQQYDSKQWRNFQYFIYDKAGTACVGNSSTRYGGGGRQGNEIVAVELTAFPRRQGKFLVRVEENGNQGQDFSEKAFVIHNPAAGKLFFDWTPDPLPNTQEDDDLSVTLTKFFVGAKTPYQRNDVDDSDPLNKGVEATFQVERDGKPVTNWQPVSVETTDATSNRVSGWIAGNQWQDSADSVTYQYGLWPDEPAWKVRFEFSQQSDFAPNELWSVQNIPVQPGKQMDFYNSINRRNSANTPFTEGDVNGVHLKIFPAKQFADMPPNAQPQGGLLIEATPPLPAGMRLTITKLTDDQTNDIGFWENSYNPGQNMTIDQCQLRDVAGVTNLNLTIAVHKSRFVEFTVKPEKAPADADNQQ